MKEYKDICGNANRKHYNCSSNTKVSFFVQNLPSCVFQWGIESIPIWSFMQFAEIILFHNKKILLWFDCNKIIIITLSLYFIDRCILSDVVVLNRERKVRLRVPALTNILVIIWMQKAHIVVDCVLFFHCSLC